MEDQLSALNDWVDGGREAMQEWREKPFFLRHDKLHMALLPVGGIGVNPVDTWCRHWSLCVSLELRGGVTVLLSMQARWKVEEFTPGEIPRSSEDYFKNSKILRQTKKVTAQNICIQIQ